YSVRLLSEGFFGQDIAIPSLNVTYNIQAAAGNGAQGRDQTYVLPPLPVRVAMLVPKDAAWPSHQRDGGRRHPLRRGRHAPRVRHRAGAWRVQAAQAGCAEADLAGDGAARLSARARPGEVR